MDINEERKKIENERREKLKREKPLVYEKIMKYAEKEQKGESTAIIDFCFDYACNMNCSHCCNRSFAKKERELTISDLKDFANQADALGLAQFNISGGEPLYFKNFDEIVAAINPEKFHISISTNGLLLDDKMADHLKAIGVDKVRISLDSIDVDAYSNTRHQKQGYYKAVDALFSAKKAGLQVNVLTVFSHQNVRTEASERLAEFCQKNNFSLDVMIARAIGKWEGKEEVLIDSEDAKYIVELKQKYPVVHRDVFPTYGREAGSCGCVEKILHLTKYGDILPCTFMHISIGNIFEESLKDIIDRGFKIKYFRHHGSLCLSGENRFFIRNYMSKFYGKPLPVHWSEVFTNDDFITD